MEKETLEEIKNIVSASFYDDKNLWNAERVGQYLGGLKATTIRNRYACRPDYPPSYDFDKTRVWKTSEVKEWAEKYRRDKIEV